MNAITKPRRLIIDAAPLWEMQFTGISNVVCELASRFATQASDKYSVLFSAFDKIIDINIINECTSSRNGKALQDAVNSGSGVSDIDKFGLDYDYDSGLYLHVKGKNKRFKHEAHLYYDFSFLSVPECHLKDTIDFHKNNLVDQVRSTDVYFCISESTANDLKWYFGVEEKDIVISYLGHNADLDSARFAKDKFSNMAVEPFALILGTIEPRKNIDLILSWLAQNRNVLDMMRFVFAGREGWGPRFAELIDRHCLNAEFDSGRIMHLGYVTESQKAALVATATVMMYPSIFEGFGLPVLEAMALGVPIIASCSTSIPEVMGPHGLYFDPYSTQSLNDAYNKFIVENGTGRIHERVKLLENRSHLFSYDGTFNTIRSEIEKRFF